MTQERVLSERTMSSPVLGLVWFGAAVSLAEILTGSFFAPLGFTRGVAAIVLGHVIGGFLFFLVAYISATTGRNAMDCVRISFGRWGSVAFSLMNVIQLVGWTAIMVVSGAAAATYLVPALGVAGWCVVIGALIVGWIAVDMRTMSRVQSVASIALLVLTFVVSSVVFSSTGTPAVSESVSFGAAVELAVAMPLSWLPVVGDYLCTAKRPFPATVAATLAYSFGSCWMFAIGLGLTIQAGTSDVAAVLAQAGLGTVGLLVVVFSTVTTTFLDAQSAGVSAHMACSAIPSRMAGVAAAVLGTLLAIGAPVANFEGFLYLIGSVFAPMATILCVDWFILGNDATEMPFNGVNAVLWFVGFVLYRISMQWDIVVGNTVVVMVSLAVLSLFVHTVVRQFWPRFEPSKMPLSERNRTC